MKNTLHFFLYIFVILPYIFTLQILISCCNRYRWIFQSYLKDYLNLIASVYIRNNASSCIILKQKSLAMYPVTLHTTCAPDIDNKYERDSIWKVFNHFVWYFSRASNTRCVNKYCFTLRELWFIENQRKGKNILYFISLILQTFVLYIILRLLVIQNYSHSTPRNPFKANEKNAKGVLWIKL